MIDHHVPALDAIQPYEEKIIIVRSSDVRKSGCILTWDYFFDSPAPWFLQYVADRDTWSWELPNSKEINTALFEDRHISQEGLAKLHQGETSVADLVTRGQQLLEMKHLMVQKFVHAAVACRYKEYTIWLYNCLGEFRSDVGNALLDRPLPDGRRADFSVSWHFDFPTEYWLSLRSDDTRPDVCAIAKEIAPNGGGHRNAAGVTINHAQFIQLFSKMN